MAQTLQVGNMLGKTPQPVTDASGSASPVALSTEKVGIGTLAPVSKVHIVSAGADFPPRLETAPNTTGAFAAGWDFYPGGVGKGYVGVPDASAGFGAGEMLVYGAEQTPTSLWAGRVRGLTVKPDGNVGIGTADPGDHKLHVEGNIYASGDITLSNADCAEDFDICDTEIIEPGTVMVLGEEGLLYPSQHAYDKRVAGVISGAGGYRPGIVLDKQDSATVRRPIALLGKVYCKVDAGSGPIDIGDLLTTSSTPGHAMKADPLHAFGTVIGKALRPMAEGRGLIPILIALQ